MPSFRGASWALRVGVTGHRDLAPEHVEDLRRVVRLSLEDVVGAGPANRVEVVTGMADGADALVTAVARELGCRVEVALPKQLDDYRKELTDGTRAQLDELLTDAATADSNITVAEVGAGPLPDAADPSEPYVRLGRYLTRSCDVLLALWDGGAEHKPGGTHDVLARFLAGSGISLYDPGTVSTWVDGAPTSGAGPVALWVPTVRAATASGVDPGDRHTYLVGSDAQGVWYRTTTKPAQLADLIADLAGIDATVAAARGYPLLQDMPSGLSPDLSRSLEEIHDAYLQADGLAVAHQARSDRAFAAAGLIAAAMGFCFLWFAKIDDHLGWLYAYLGLFAVGYLVYQVAHRGAWLRRHLSMRALAETLRVHFFVTLLGLGSDVDFRRIVSDSGVSTLPGFAVVGTAASVGTPPEEAGVSVRSEREEIVRCNWVDDQAAYFRRRAHQFHRRHELLESVQRALYGLAFVGVVAIIVFGSDLKKWDVFGDTSSKTFIVFLMGLLPLWLTFWELHQGRMATGELLWQFRNQEHVFNDAAAVLAAAPAESRRYVYAELAERSLFETYLWTLHRFHREFSPPSGG